ncbi:MAG: ABC transporter ATP-binding protein [Desulfobulbaceae bacterium]|nr:ABC transporter ATP-binding protein [Desulfobulbaceae bacterium]
MKFEVKDLCRSFTISRGRSHAALDKVTFQLQSGSFTVILGESGSGKSTLLNLLSGLIFPTTGQILADNTAIHGPSPDRNLLFQQPNLLPWLSVADNILFGCRLRGDTDNLGGRLTHLLEMIDLSGCEDRLPAELSVGMAQRVCLARALIGNPKSLLLDEPFGALDIFNRLRLQNELLKIWQNRPFTGILVTHDIDEALIVAEKIIILGGQPATVKSVYDVALPYPRDISSHSFFEARSQIIQLLRAAASNWR